MPKHEFDPEDPMELTGVGLMTDEDTMDEMTECFIEEFMRLGHNHKHLLALFRNPHYIGMNMVLQNKGEAYVRERISEVFAKWGRPFTWPAHSPKKVESVVPNQDVAGNDAACGPTDPMGEPLPELNF
jgi:hypothetical protein